MNSDLSSLEKQFDEYSKRLTQQSELKEAVKTICQQIEPIIKSALVYLQNIHSAIPKIEILSTESENKVLEAKPLLSTLREAMNGQEVSKYHDAFRWTITQICFIILFSRWLRTNILLSLPQLETILQIENKNEENKAALSVEIEDYLSALTQLSGELSRLCITSVISENYTLPKRISLFANELYSAFRLLNLKNDHLRKRFDSMKYDLKKIEEVMYDITVRKLVPSTTPVSSE
eukprot:TRINITY_DN5550_c0_g1_i1.p1 TRINITY_DN5550_c0_g1~~TRINITY_DN5550_c0_g1_i1.p1  ORF type:complete len:241 (+),score=56.28 TRINITY_DN5550_c0_g1_i1:24-725(+)